MDCNERCGPGIAETQSVAGIAKGIALLRRCDILDAMRWADADRCGRPHWVIPNLGQR